MSALLLAVVLAFSVRGQVVDDTLRVAVPVRTRTVVVHDTLRVARVDTLWMAPAAPAAHRGRFPSWLPPAAAGAILAGLAAVLACRASGHGKASVSISVGGSGGGGDGDDCDHGRGRGKGKRR